MIRRNAAVCHGGRSVIRNVGCCCSRATFEVRHVLLYETVSTTGAFLFVDAMQLLPVHRPALAPQQKM